MKKGSFKEAAILFRREGSLKIALSCMEKCYDYNGYVELCVELGISGEQCSSSLIRMVQHFKNVGRFHDAANVLCLMHDEV